jgi:hypothetical protein
MMEVEKLRSEVMRQVLLVCGWLCSFPPVDFVPATLSKFCSYCSLQRYMRLFYKVSEVCLYGYTQRIIEIFSKFRPSS